MKTRLYATATCMLLWASLAYAEQPDTEHTSSPPEKGESAEAANEHLTGNWGGKRTELEAQGLDFDIVLKSDVYSNLSGGLQRGTAYLDNWDFKLKADTGKLWGWGTSTGYFHVISEQGAKFNKNYVGSTMGVDNIETSVNTTKVFQAWIEKTWLDKYSLLAGLYPVDSEFYVTEAAGIFLHPTGGMAAEVAQTGINGPSIFPTSSFGVRATWRATSKFSVKAAVVDGVPGDPHNPYGTHIQFNHGDGTFQIAEIGYHAAEIHEVEPIVPQKGVPEEPAYKTSESSEGYGNYAVGFWNYSSHFNDIANNTLQRGNNSGAYLMAEQTVYDNQGIANGKDVPHQALALFMRYGFANGDINPIDFSYSYGLNVKGLVPGRENDEFGIMVTRSHAGARYRQGTSLTDYESFMEITYRASVLPWLHIQPALQHIASPSFDPAIPDSWIAAVRFETEF